MKKKLLVSFLALIACCELYAQNTLLQSGPMVGYSSYKEVMLWVQTKAAAKVHFEYVEKENPGVKMKSEVVETGKGDAFTARIPVAVSEGKKYSAQLFINGKVVSLPYPFEFKSQKLWQFRTDPPDFSLVFGSCNYVNEPEVDRPGNPYGSGHQIFKSIADKKPDLMLWGGDNTYLREVDWDTRSGILHRYTHTRSLPEMQALLASTHHYALWDDHDYGPNDSDRSYWLKEEALNIFKYFWPNPNFGPGGGTSGTFSWNDVQFFLLDNRYFRSPNNGNYGPREMFGEKQVQWLIDALTSSRATFKIVAAGGQILNPVNENFFEGYTKFAGERDKLLNALKEAKIPGLILLSGDRHHSELSKMDREGTYPLYELTASPFTAGPVGDRAKNEKNTFRLPDTYYGEHNFAWLEVSGPRKERVLTIRLCSTDGKEIWKKEIKANELK